MRPEGNKEGVAPISGERSMLGRRKRSTKVLRKRHAWHIQETTMRPGELVQREQRGNCGKR